MHSPWPTLALVRVAVGAALAGLKSWIEADTGVTAVANATEMTGRSFEKII